MRSASCMAAALPEYLQRVTDVREAGVCGDSMRPRFHFRTFDLHREAAGTANEVVMVLLELPRCGRTTATVSRLTVGPYDDVDRAVLCEPAEVPVDGGESDRLAAAAQFVVQRLRGQKAVGGGERLVDRRTLSGGAPPR